MAGFAVRINDFSGGDFGSFDLARPADDVYSATNMQQYDSGLLGVRAGLKQLPVSGLPGYTFVPGPIGFDVWNDKLIISMGAALWQVPFAGGAATQLPAYPAAQSQRTRFARGNNNLFSLVNGVLYQHTAGATTTITTPAPLSNLVRWGYFMVGTDRNVPWRIWFSQVDASGPNFGVWPAINYIDVANNEPITALAPIYNTLYVGKPSGWYGLSGVLGVATSLREMQLGNGPIDQRFVSVTTDNRVIYWPLQSVPAWWNGERVHLDEQFELSPRGLPFLVDGVIVTPTARRLILASDNTEDNCTDILTWKGSAWNRYDFPMTLTGFTPADVRAGYQMPDNTIYAVKRPDTVGEQPVIYSFNHDLNRPAHINDQYAAPVDHGKTDLVTGTVRFPNWWEPQGRQVRVRSVIVQFRKWASGIEDHANRIQCTATALGAYERGPETGNVADWVEAQSRASTTGNDDSVRFNFGNQGWGNGFSISFPMLRGVALREVTILVDMGTART